MTDGEGRARFQFAEVQQQQTGQDQEAPEAESPPPDQVILAVPTCYHSNSPEDLDPGGVGTEGHDEGEEEDRGDWREEIEEEEEQEDITGEPELGEVPGPTVGVRIRAPIRDPDCISEEEEQQPYPALAPVAFFCLKQTTRPRNWCLRVVCNPYPFSHATGTSSWG
ncbi:unnamed protein product [Knipowitschia caucasica]|uniref:Uncharacterized protein n=1 Tax=Knipowitschia caucasica TaxID=637954 RepID=A0AAV2KLN3_KNICA